jgi:hypothetical protein
VHIDGAVFLDPGNCGRLWLPVVSVNAAHGGDLGVQDERSLRHFPVSPTLVSFLG